MAQITQGGVRIFSGASQEALESTLNTFLYGDGTVDDPRKIIQHVQFTIDGGTFYALVVYQTFA